MMKNLRSNMNPPQHEVHDVVFRENINSSLTTSWSQNGSKKETDRIESTLNETISEWFVGRVLEVNFEEGYFEAQIKDTRGVESTVEFDIDTVFEDHLDLEQHLFPGAKFVFSMVSQPGRERQVIQNNIEFTNPYISRKEPFPADPSLRD